MARIMLRSGAIPDVRRDLGGISQAKLCRLMKIDPSTAWRVEHGGEPSPKFIAGLMLVSGSDFSDLFAIERVEVVAS